MSGAYGNPPTIEALKERLELIKTLPKEAKELILSTLVREAETDRWILDLQVTEMSLKMGIARMGGKVEGRPPGFHNFLQRIDKLVRIEKILKRVFKASFVFAESIQEDAVDAFDLDQLKAMNKALDKAVEEFGDPTVVKGGA